MHITNKLELPETFVNTVTRSNHKKADISVTELEKSPREYWLVHRHDDKIYIDVADMIWMIFGSAIHKVLESGSTHNQLTEEYLTTTVAGHTLSGTSDLYENKKISDYKSTSVYTLIFGSRMEEWTRQLNVYRLLLTNANFEVNELEIVALFKDWQRSKAKFNDKYPQKPVARIQIPIWEKERVEKYIKERVEIIMKHKDTPDKDLPRCTDDEMWRKEAVYKCMKPGCIRSKKNFDDKAEAEKYCADNKLTLLSVPGECVKCQDYCYAAQFCNQYMSGLEPPISKNEHPDDFATALAAAKAKADMPNKLPEATPDMLLEEAKK